MQPPPADAVDSAAVELFSTSLNTPDNRRILMPNNSILGKVIENSMVNPRRATAFFAAAAEDCDVEKVRSALTRACLSCPSVLREPSPEILVDDLLDGGLRWSITVWAETPALKRARDEAITAVRDALAHDRIGGPKQVTTVRLLGAAASATPAT
jgi:small conductance mechanosensitive channel